MEQSSSYLEPSAASEPKSRAKSCTECRQVKLKCDYREKAPEPCSRCAKRGLVCKKDASFKRVPSRARRQEAAAAAAAVAGTSTGTAGSSRGSSAGVEGSRRESMHNPALVGATQPRILRITAVPAGETFSLGDIVLSSQSAFQLLQHVDSHLYENLPFLEPIYSLSQLYADETLFWSLIAVSARLRPEWNQLYDRLRGEYEDSLYQRMFLGTASIKKIHAALILCLWPFPVETQEADSTCTLAGSAMSMAMQLGLHKRNMQQEYYEGLTPRVDSDAYIRDMTWIACIQNTTNIGFFLDLPAPLANISILRGVNVLSASPSFPLSCRASIVMYSRAARLFTAMESGIDAAKARAAYNLFENELSQARNAFSASWTLHLETEMLFVNLYALGNSFIPDLTDTRQSLEHARSALLRGLALASSLISAVVRGSSPSPVHSPPMQQVPSHSSLGPAIERTRYYPKSFFRHLIFAAYYLLFFISTPMPQGNSVSSPPSPAYGSQVVQDHQTAQAWLQLAIAFLMSMPNPEGVRIGRSLAIKAKYSIQSKGGIPPQASSRMAQLVLSCFDPLGRFLREALLGPGAGGPYSGPRRSSTVDTESTVSVSPEVMTMAVPAPITGSLDLTGPGAGWVEHGAGYDMGLGVGVEVPDMSQVYQGMEMWGLGGSDWSEMSFEGVNEGMPGGRMIGHGSQGSGHNGH